MKNVVVTKINNFQPHTKSDGTWYEGPVWNVQFGNNFLDSYTVYTEEDALKVKSLLVTTK